MKQFYQNKIILITGATSGVGADLTEVLLHFGATVIGIGLEAAQFIDLKNKTANHQERLHCFAFDITDQSEMIEVAEKIKSRIGIPDIIIACAGLGGINPADFFSAEIDQRIMTVNYFGMVNTFHLFLKEFIQKRAGHLVVISSVAAFRGLPNSSSYCASKSAQAIFLESWRVDLKKYNIHVTSIHPGFIKTRMLENHEDTTPFIIDLRRSSNLILKAIYQNKSDYVYPFTLKIASYILRLLPQKLYDVIFIMRTRSKQYLFNKPRIF